MHFANKLVWVSRDIFIVFALLVYAGCNDESDPVPSQLELLQRKGGWNLTSSKIDPPLETPNGLISDTYPGILPCHKDDILVFSADGKVTIIDELLCDPPETNFPPGVYFFDESKKLLSINGELGSEVEITISELKFNLKGTIDGIPRTLSLRYVGK